MRSILFVVFMAATASLAFPQQDSTWVSYSGGFDFREGVYADFQALRQNTPTWPLALLKDEQGVDVRDLRDADRLFIPDSAGGRREIQLDRQWGFCNNNIVYLVAGGSSYRIGQWGTLCHVLFEQRYQSVDPYYGAYGSTTQTVQVQYLLDMDTGGFEPFEAATMEKILARDPILYEEWSSLDKKDKRRPEVLHQFRRRYNDRHPLFFPR